ncbi:MAG: hypothetical protein JSS02_17200 [Planctomycetes bacterium]|nr:hypothetical protein [Planctomycetota bacterium]
MTINGHFIILILALGLFARVWTTNDRQRPPVVWRIQNRTLTEVAPREPVVTEIDTPIRSVTNVINDAAREEVWTVSDCPIPLPSGLPAGEFRVVSDTGRVARLILTEAHVVADSDLGKGSADLQTITIESHRWYFIRLHTPVAQNEPVDAVDNAVPVGSLPVLPVDDVVRVADANRKFDFPGYDTAVPVASAEVISDFRPESPALPENE